MVRDRSDGDTFQRELSDSFARLQTLTIPDQIVLHRIGPHYWIPLQVIVWGLVEVLQMFVKNASGWYAARLFLGIAESGFIPGGLYTLSRWYTQDELATRTAWFFFGPSMSAAFGSLISAGALQLEGEGGLKGWQWIFLICGLSTIGKQPELVKMCYVGLMYLNKATGIIALALVPKSPYHTDRLFAGLVPTKGWFTEREADIYVARIIRKDPKKGQASTMKIGIKDM